MVLLSGIAASVVLAILALRSDPEKQNEAVSAIKVGLAAAQINSMLLGTNIQLLYFIGTLTSGQSILQSASEAISLTCTLQGFG